MNRKSEWEWDQLLVGGMGRAISGIPKAPLRTLLLSAHWSLNQDEKWVLCFEALFCAQRSPRSWKSLYFKLWWFHPLSTSVLVKFHPEKSFNKEYTGQSMNSKRGRRVEEGPRRHSGQQCCSSSSPLISLTPSPSYPLSHLYLHCSIMGDETKHSFFFQHNSWDKQLLLMTFLKLRA